MLGPLLFLICIDNLPNSSKLFKFFLFVDDTNIYFEADDRTGLIRKVNKELKTIKVWMDCNKLAWNIKKTNFVLLHSPKKKTTDLNPLNFDKEIIKRDIKRDKYAKFLGALLQAEALASFSSSYQPI